MSLKSVLNTYGQIGVQIMKQAVAPYRASGQTEDSISYKVEAVLNSDQLGLFFYARDFITTLETGRGPRKNSQQSDFKDNIEDWMRIRGIGSGLNEKKFKQLARFLTYKINRDGDKLFQKGGRDLFSNDLQKLLTVDLPKEIAKDTSIAIAGNIKKQFK